MGLECELKQVTETTATVYINCTASDNITSVICYLNDDKYKTVEPNAKQYETTLYLTDLTPYSEYELSVTATTDDEDYSAGVLIETLPIYVTSVNIKNITVNKGEYAKINPIIEPANASDTELVYECSNKGLTIENGVVYTESTGEYTVTAKTTDGSEISTTFTVTAEIVSEDVTIPLLDNIAPLKIGQKYSGKIPIVYKTTPYNSTDRKNVEIEHSLRNIEFSNGYITVNTTSHETDRITIQLNNLYKAYFVEVSESDYAFNEFPQEIEYVGVPEFAVMLQNLCYIMAKGGITGVTVPTIDFSTSAKAACVNFEGFIRNIINASDKNDISIFWEEDTDFGTVKTLTADIYRKWLSFTDGAKSAFENNLQYCELRDIDDNIIVDIAGNKILIYEEL